MMTIRLPEDLRRWLRIEAATRDVSMSEMVRALVEAERKRVRR